MEPLKAYGVHVIKMDVTDERSMQDGVETLIQAMGHIDVLINNAGYGYFGAIENVPMEEARRQLEVNVFGLARLTQLVLPYMRQQKSGRIINTSSIAGKMVFYMGGWYNITKYSVEAFSDALRMEMKPYGIDVVMIEPGSTVMMVPSTGTGTDLYASSTADCMALAKVFGSATTTSFNPLARPEKMRERITPELPRAPNNMPEEAAEDNSERAPR